MWIIIGLIVGGSLGASGGLDDMIGSAVLGSLIGLAVQWWVGRASGGRLDALEQRIAGLEAEVARLRQDATTADEDLPKMPTPVPDRAPVSDVSAPAIPVQQPAATPAMRRRGIDLIDPGAATEPGTLAQALATMRGWLLGGNTVVRVGLLVLFFGLAFLARYAAENRLFPIEMRLAAIAAGAAVLLGLGWHLRQRKAGYGLSLQGGGVAALYLTIFAAMRLYGLLSPAVGFALLLGVVVLSAALALVQRSQAMAVIGTAGGFMAPILASTGQGSHVMLFSYYLLLNVGVLGVAWKQAWRGLNLTGFLFTFSIALFWGARDYQPALFGTTEPFLVAYCLMYVAAAVLYAWRSAPQLRHYVDGTVVFGTPVVGFGLQAALTDGMPHALAVSALVVGGFYLGLAQALRRRARPSLALLADAFMALGVAFLTMAIPLAVDGRWTGAAWALEGAALLWVGARQQRKLAMAAGVLLQWAAGALFLGNTVLDTEATPAVLNRTSLGAALLAIAGLVSAHVADRWRGVWPRFMHAVMPVMLAWGLLWWAAGGFNEIEDALPFEQQPVALLLFLSVSGAFATLWADRLGWSVLRWPALFPLVGMAMALIGEVDANQSPWSGWGLLAWPLAALALGWSLRRAEGDGLAARVLAGAHVGALWLLALSLAVSASHLSGVGDLWQSATMLLVPVAAWWGLMRAAQRWPVCAWPAAYLQVGAGGLLAAGLVWAVGVSVARGGSAAPLPYLPLLNPFDLATGLLIAAGAGWWRHWRSALAFDARIVPGVLGVSAFVLITLSVIRAVHHLAAVPWDVDRLFASDPVQASVSLLWGILGLMLTFLGSRHARRLLWMAGAALLGVVVLKLFLVDMASTGTVARIVSFIGAGVLLLVVGYFSPLPPTPDAFPAEGGGDAGASAGRGSAAMGADDSVNR